MLRLAKSCVNEKNAPIGGYPMARRVQDRPGAEFGRPETLIRSDLGPLRQEFHFLRRQNVAVTVNDLNFPFAWHILG